MLFNKMQSICLWQRRSGTGDRDQQVSQRSRLRQDGHAAANPENASKPRDQSMLALLGNKLAT